MRDRRRPGMTLIELLVVVAVIAILAGLLLPAIIQARGAARKARCESNLKQLAQAVQSFHHRNDCLPVYWGPMGASSNKLGGWLFHMLPDLDQQAAFDSVPGNATLTTTTLVPVTTVIPTGVMLPAIPASDDYSPGTWKEIVTGTTTVFVNGVQQTIVEKEWVLEGRKGTPGLPARPETITVATGSFTTQSFQTSFFPLATEYVALGRQTTLPGLIDAEDIGAFRSPSLATSGTSDLSNQQLTNYQANAHVFTRFGTRLKGTEWHTGWYTERAGLFPTGFLLHQDPDNRNNTWWRHSEAPIRGMLGRSLNQISDGLTNTILFAEGRRQCDNLAQYRAAFFPTNNEMNEHGFGIEPTWRRNDGTADSGKGVYGNTLMFQTMPTIAETNPLRVQALHGNYLMVAMCDGSTRAISSLVSRREPIGVNASGRENFGTVFYTNQSRGADPASPRPDGIWDMLMVPNDPTGNVLSNSGEIGREQ